MSKSTSTTFARRVLGTDRIPGMLTPLLAGIALGLLGAWGAARAIQVPFVVPLLAMPVAFFVSVAVGAVFGVAPARKASRLNPLAALRFE